MLRESTNAGAAHVVFDVKPDGGLEFMSRTQTNGSTSFLNGGTASATNAWLKLTRSGNLVSAFTSADGSTWTAIGTTNVSFAASALVGLVVCSHTTGLNTATFDHVTVSGPSTQNVVIYAGDIATSALHGNWARASDPSSPNGSKLTSNDIGSSNPDAPLASPADYVDVSFTADAGVPYTVWLRLQATANSKYNDSLWVQFSDALANGSSVYPLNSANGLLVNLATDSAATSLNGWGWANGAYWLSQPTTVTIAASGSHTLRIQLREDGVQLDQIVLSPTTYLNSAPGPATNDSTIVPK
jgi:hypothetical protein